MVKAASLIRTGTPWAIRVLGFMMVTSWCSRSGWDSNSSGASFLITSSSCSAAKPGAPYQVLGSPLVVNKNTRVTACQLNSLRLLILLIFSGERRILMMEILATTAVWK